MDYYFHDIEREGNIDMTFEQIELVQKAWGRVSALNNSYVQEVYEELFRLPPELRALFPPHQELPVAKVSDTLNTVITSLSQLDALGFIIRDLGRRHQRFNVQCAAQTGADPGTGTASRQWFYPGTGTGTGLVADV
ncbi:globin domain-containing protein [Aeromonas caviae]|uniref:globin domain-containing protein n=1 Tax=Aeromonas TaxID=642 RepID=UPI001F2CA18F|nr:MULTISPECIES: globin domain-containing protein [Aeromonas]UTI03901.1 globin domain-containing protein [Aeromonas caviae]